MNNTKIIRCYYEKIRAKDLWVSSFYIITSLLVYHSGLLFLYTYVIKRKTIRLWLRLRDYSQKTLIII